ncbi:MAG: cell wall hydrolase [archaeon]
MVNKKRNHDLRNWFLGTVAVGAVPLLLLGGNRSVSSGPAGGVEKKLVCPSEVAGTKYCSEDIKELQNVLYGEAANQSSRGRKFIARVILNRVRSPDYQNSVHGVVYEKNAFSCVFDNVNRNWKQVIGKLPMNGYEKIVYEKCREDARAIFDGEILGVPREKEIIAYHDVSIAKPNDKYWNGLEPVEKVGRLIFYVPKKKG